MTTESEKETPTEYFTVNLGKPDIKMGERPLNWCRDNGTCNSEILIQVLTRNLETKK